MKHVHPDPADQKIRTAFILGAGLGTRLRPLTQLTPKPLLPVGGRPIITHAMEHLRAAGVTRFIINTHHCPEKYLEAFPEGRWEDVPITFRHEPVLLDTAGGIKNIEDLIGQDRRIIVYNGDIITNLPLEPLLKRHTELCTEATLALRSRGPLTNVHIDSQGFICDMRNTLHNPGVQACLFAGIYILETAFCGGLRRENRIDCAAAHREHTAKSRSVGGIVIDEGFWHDLGTMEEYRTLRDLTL